MRGTIQLTTSDRMLASGKALLLFALIGYQLMAKAQQRPNILIIMTDEQSADAMSNRLGKQYLNTPNMDALAARGISFTNAYCANPLCTPSRTALFTGRYPHETGIQSNQENLIDPLTFPSMGTLFSKAGYETGYIGKWHLPYDRNRSETHGFSYLPDKKGNGNDSLSPQKARKFFETNRKAPFLLVVSFMNPHNICQWARGEELPNGPIGEAPPGAECPPLRPNALPSANETDIMQLARTSMQKSKMFPVGNFTNDQWRQYIWSYYRLIEKVDSQLGELLQALKETGHEQNTLVVFTSDHGDMQGAHRWNQKTVLYEEAAKVPLIFSYPGLQKKSSALLVQTGIDLLPTLCGFAGIDPPATIRGLSLKSTILNENIQVNRRYIVVSDHLTQGEPIDGVKPEPEGRMLRNGQFKYWIYNLGIQRETLYDLKNDPGEMVNLASDSRYRQQLQECRRQLKEWALANKDPFIDNLY